jgi:hypothetical protein
VYDDHVSVTMGHMIQKAKDGLFFLFILLLPTQLGKHFFLPFSYIHGVKVDYLSLVLCTTDILAFILIILNFTFLYQTIKKKILIWFVFIFLISINITFAYNSIESLYHAFKYLELIFIFIIFSRYKNPKLILIAFVSGALFELILCIMQFITKSSIQGIFYFFGERYITLSHAGIAKIGINGEEFLRPYGTFSHPNSLGGFYLLLYVFTLWYKPFQKFTFFKRALLTISSFLIVLSFSQTATILFVLANCFFVFFYKKNANLFFKILLLLSLLSIAFALSTFKHDPSNITVRIDLLTHSFVIFLKHVVFGVGLGNYLYYESFFNERSSYFFLQPVHNVFALFITEAGIFLSLFSAFVLKKFVFKKNTVFFWSVVVLVCAGMVDHYFLTLQQNFLLLGIIFGLAQLPKASARLSDLKDCP